MGVICQDHHLFVSTGQFRGVGGAKAELSLPLLTSKSSKIAWIALTFLGSGVVC